MSNALYKQVTDQTTTSGNFVDIEGLSFYLPQAQTGANAALVTLNVPQPYVNDGTSNGIIYQIDVSGVSQATGSWTNQNSQNGRSPFTLVTLIPLNGGPQYVQAQWGAVRGATAYLGGSASLSAILVQV